MEHHQEHTQLALRHSVSRPEPLVPEGRRSRTPVPEWWRLLKKSIAIQKRPSDRCRSGLKRPNSAPSEPSGLSTDGHERASEGFSTASRIICTDSARAMGLFLTGPGLTVRFQEPQGSPTVRAACG